MKVPVAGSTVPEYAPGGLEGHSCLGEVKEDDVIRCWSPSCGQVDRGRADFTEDNGEEQGRQARTPCASWVLPGFLEQAAQQPLCRWAAAGNPSARRRRVIARANRPIRSSHPRHPVNEEAIFREIFGWPYPGTRPVAARTFVPGESPWASTRGARARATRSRTRTKVVLAARSSPFITPMAAAAQ